LLLVLVIARHRQDATLEPAPHGVEAAQELLSRTVGVGQIADHQDGRRSAIEQPRNTRCWGFAHTGLAALREVTDCNDFHGLLCFRDLRRDRRRLCERQQNGCADLRASFSEIHRHE